MISRLFPSRASLARLAVQRLLLCYICLFDSSQLAMQLAVTAVAQNCKSIVKLPVATFATGSRAQVEITAYSLIFGKQFFRSVQHNVLQAIFN